MGHFAVLFIAVLLILFVAIPVSAMGMPVVGVALDDPTPPAPERNDSCQEHVAEDGPAYMWCS